MLDNIFLTPTYSTNDNISVEDSRVQRFLALIAINNTLCAQNNALLICKCTQINIPKFSILRVVQYSDTHFT